MAWGHTLGYIRATRRSFGVWVESESGPFFWRVGKSGGSGPPAAGFAGGASPSRHAPPSRAGRGGALSKGPGDTPDRPWCCCDTTSRRPSEQDTPTKRRCEDPGGPISGRDGGCRWAASTERTNGRRGPARHQERRRQPPRPAPARYAPGRDHERASRTHDAKAQGTPAAPSAATTAAVRGRHGAERQTRACTYLRSAAASQLAPPPRLIRTRPRALVPALALRVLGLGVERECARDLQGRVEGGDGGVVCVRVTCAAVRAESWGVGYFCLSHEPP